MKNLPNILTLSRIALLPILIGLMYGEYYYGAKAAWAALGVYIIIALTDFFDGWIARKYKTSSAFGAFLDPVADKIFVGVILVALVGFNRLPGIWMVPAMIIIAREFMVSGLREYLGSKNVPMPVSNLAKWKTATQMIAVAFLIIGPHMPGAWIFGQWMIILAAILTVVTGGAYLKTGLDHMRKST
jgi:cardiolipin synthase